MGRTYNEIIIEMKQYAKQRWPDWNIDARHIGNIILECLSDQIEKLEFRVDEMESELFPDTATKYRSVLRWARMTGYPVRSVQPASVMLKFTLPDPPETPITIPKGTVITTKGLGLISFETTMDAQMNDIEVDIPALQTESKVDAFTGSGEQFQVYQSSWGPVWEESVDIAVNNKHWQRVLDFLNSNPADLHFATELQDDGTVLVMFGNGLKGFCPPSGSEIEMRYKISKGSVGNVAANTIKEIQDPLYDEYGYLINMAVTNNQPSEGGQNQETLNQIKDNIPRWIITTKACISKPDFENASLLVTGVERALAHGRDQDPAIPALEIWVYIVPTGGGEPGQVLLDRVYDELAVKRSKVNGVQIKTKAPQYLMVDINCNFSAGLGYEAATLMPKIEQAISAFFSYERVDPDGTFSIDWGKPVYIAQLTSYIMSRVSGIANISFSGISDFFPAFNEIPGLRAVTVNVT